MEIVETYRAASRAAWRAWLETHHASATEVFASAAVERALRADPATWANFTGFPRLYQRVRVGYVEETSGRPVEFERRLNHLVTRTARGEMFGNWSDDGRRGGVMAPVSRTRLRS